MSPSYSGGATDPVADRSFRELYDGISGGRQITLTSNGTPNTEDTVVHDLGRVPRGFLVIKQDKAASVYDSGTAWTQSRMYVKTSVASVATTFWIF